MLKASYVIFVCCFDAFDLDVPIYHFEIFDSNLQLKLEDGSRTMILALWLASDSEDRADASQVPERRRLPRRKTRAEPYRVRANNFEHKMFERENSGRVDVFLWICRYYFSYKYGNHTSLRRENRSTWPMPKILLGNEFSCEISGAEHSGWCFPGIWRWNLHYGLSEAELIEM